MLNLKERLEREMEQWFEILRRTIKSRDSVLTKVEMEEGGILEVINVSVALGFHGDGDAMEAERIESIIRQGRYDRGDEVVVMVESGVRGVVNPFTGDRGFLRVYSGIVFADEWSLHLFVLRHPEVYGKEMNEFSRLVN